jgi:protein TonB
MARALASAALLAASLVYAQAPPRSVYPDVPFVEGAPVRSRPDFDYPREALARRLEGTLLVAVLVGEDGSVIRHRILSAEPPLIFNRAVDAAMPEFRFAPAERDGKPSRYETHLSLLFKPPVIKP